jgi:hypothetical protein
MMPAKKDEQPPLGAMTIREFCNKFRISERYYYILQKRGIGPLTMQLGSRQLISNTAANEWRIAREQAKREKQEGGHDG